MRTRTKRGETSGLIALVVAGMVGLAAAGGNKEEAAAGLRVHEWGTFTTLHWSHGNGLAWYQDTAAAKSSELPSFVHQSLLGTKSRSWGGSTARMETPVLYFYTDKRQNVDVSVTYEGGMITEFYPKGWKGMELIPPGEAGELGERLPVDPERPDNHYYSARAVPDAAFVRSVPAPDAEGNQAPDELEKFVFYRGVGTFNTQLVPTLSPGGVMGVGHYNSEYGMRHVWVLQSSAGAIRWTKLPAFAAYDRDAGAEEVEVAMGKLDARGSRDESVGELAESMVSALVEEGLTPSEAAAMVATWDDQWYEEPGQRVFSIPPQVVIDAVLPLDISPQPTEVVRVFVHRQEVLSPETQDLLELALAPDSDPGRAQETVAQLELGRFVHGAIGAVADDVSQRTKAEYYARGMEAIKEGAEIAGGAGDGAALVRSGD